MSDLSVLLGDKRDAVVTELAGLAESTIESTSGISGVAVKGVLSGAKKLNSNVVPKAVNRLLPEILETLQPRWDEFSAQGAGDFGTYLNANSDPVIDSILEVLDRNVKKVDFPGVQKAYDAIRSKASDLIKPHLPVLGDVIERHMK